LSTDEIPSTTVTGLIFNANRKKATDVQLNWTTQTENNMSGYEVQRMLKNEIDFSARSFVNSLAPGGSSASQLSYAYLDANSYTDTSFYRLKIVDKNGGFTFSDVKAVAAKTKGGGNGGGGNPHVTQAISDNNLKADLSVQKITVGPNPNYGNFWFTVSGLEKETIASLFTIDGKLMKQFKVVNLQQQPVNNLNSGIYILKVPGYDAKKIVVQGDGRKGTVNGPGAPLKNQMD
jgi:hypothetical protein